MKKINIYGTDYQIKEQKFVMTHDGANDGLIDRQRKIILLDSSQKPQDKMATLLHECFHGCLYETGIGLTLEHAQEENIVEVLSKFTAAKFNVKMKRPS